MKQPHIIAETNLKTVDLKYWEGRPLNSYFDKIKSYLSQRLGPSFGDLLTEPSIKKGTDKIRWIASSSSTNVYPVNSSSDEAIKRTASNTLHTVKGLIQDLLQSPNLNEKEWGKLLSLVFNNATSDLLYTDDQSFFLPAWGAIPLSDSKIGEFATGFTDPQTPETPLPSSSKEEENTGEESNIPEAPDVTPNPSSFNSPNAENSNLNEEEKTDDISPSDLIDTSTSEEKRSDVSPMEEDWHKKTSNIEEESHTEVRKEEAFISFDKNQWWRWSLGILLLLLLIFWLFRSCNSNQAILPSAPLLPPAVDSTDIGFDKDSSAFIIKNRINIVILSDQAIENFAEDFSKVYTDRNKYKIIYYGDEHIKRIQLQVPEEERDNLMEVIPKNFPDYQLLVYPEGLLKNNAYPSDPFFSNLDAAWYFDIIKASGAWNKTWGDKDIVVAIIDDGFDIQHEELNGKILNPYNVHTRTPQLQSGKVGKHGTHVAGTAVGNRNNNAGLSGIAPDCILMPIRVGDERGIMTQTAIVDGILYAINQGADVINLSLGKMFTPDITNLPVGVQRDFIANSMKKEEAFWNQLFRIANHNNVAVVLAGGNQNILIGLDPMSRTEYTINVSATDHNNRKAEFSNFGDYSTVSAPGVDIISSVPPSGKYESMQGTSMAAPIVTGSVALLKSVNPDLSNEEIKTVLVRTALPLNDDIGPLLQLSDALGVVDSNGINLPEEANCEDTRAKVDSLLQELERLKRECPDAFEQDTMKIPEIIEDLNFSLGIWQSTTYITNDQGKKVVMQFEFRQDGTATIYFIEENGLVFTSALSLSHTKNTFIIDQLNMARSKNSTKEYYRYLFNCRADAKGQALGHAQNKTIRANNFNFRLIKIK